MSVHHQWIVWMWYITVTDVNKVLLWCSAGPKLDQLAQRARALHHSSYKLQKSFGTYQGHCIYGYKCKVTCCVNY